MTNTTMDRFQILSISELTYPHKCATCGSFSGDNNKRYVDFGCFVEFYGTVYICTECFTGAIGQLDLIPTVQYEAALTQITELKAVVTTLIAENRTLRDAVDSLRNLNHPHPDTYYVPDFSEPVLKTGPVGEPPEQEDSSRDSGGNDSDGTEGEAGSSESDDGGRSEDVHDDGAHIGLNVFDI
jgi:hypothetical protein